VSSLRYLQTSGERVGRVKGASAASARANPEAPCAVPQDLRPERRQISQHIRDHDRAPDLPQPGHRRHVSFTVGGRSLTAAAQNAGVDGRRT
jgi:hypothetical protein